jgi:hypothetical protein
VLVKLFYTCTMCFLCNSRFKSSLELMFICVIDISTLNKTYLIWKTYLNDFWLQYWELCLNNSNFGDCWSNLSVELEIRNTTDTAMTVLNNHGLYSGCRVSRMPPPFTLKTSSAWYISKKNMFIVVTTKVFMYAWVWFYVCLCIHELMFYTNVYACMFLCFVMSCNMCLW